MTINSRNVGPQFPTRLPLVSNSSQHRLDDGNHGLSGKGNRAVFVEIVLELLRWRREHRQTLAIAQGISHAVDPWSLVTVSTETSSMCWLCLLPQAAEAVVAGNLQWNEVISRQGRAQREGLLSSPQARLLPTTSSCYLKA